MKLHFVKSMDEAGAASEKADGKIATLLAGTAKIGGAAVWAAVVRPDGPGVAIKLEAGAGEAIPVVALAVLQHLDVLAAELPERLLPFARLTLRNWAGRDVGEVRAEGIDLSTTPQTPTPAAF